ncbi:DUF1674 domain-containing protein [Wenzhouxiangella sp. AB-CW3]|uniref:DUF1674 domain-containing protein n=1 Tax=Wenzhouxiangella sp. AB-CW3 TaxID=2771012 RepID=UPI00168B8073|nr:DUF1674 domain-containing protein [Wenzhouxiangella sp. AB-CW3]QOC21101.1 DUF1674 domain-containing protein [Wenzhouxiangella sp. AB-CW3]
MMAREDENRQDKPAEADREERREQPDPDRPVEIGGRRKGLEPTRYGDWEKDGRCIDF